MPFSLLASELWSKWGFGDGDRVGEALLDLEIDGNERIDARFLEDCVLEHLIRTRLLPLCPEPIEIERYETIHNPIRAAGYARDEQAPAWAESVMINVTDGDLRAAVEAVRTHGARK